MTELSELPIKSSLDMHGNFGYDLIENKNKIVKDRNLNDSALNIHAVNPKQSIGRLIKEAFLKCLSDTSLTGPQNVVKDNSHIVMKAFWLLCFLASFSYFIYCIVQTVQTYLTYPTIITTEYVQEIPTQFPAISFCNMKILDRTKSITQAYVSNYSSALNLSPFFFPTLLEWMYAQFYTLLQQINGDPSLTYTSRKAMGFQIESMLVSCMFNYLSCNISDFTYFYHPKYGNCYTFNGNLPAKTISTPGLIYGLTLELYLGNPPVDTVYNYEDGVYVSIFNQTDAPFTRMDVIKVPAGAETDLIMNRNFLSRLSPPYGKCMATEFSSDLYNYIVNTLNVSYSQEYCYSLCMQQQTKNNCSCVNLFLPMFLNDNTSFCVSAQVDCMRNLANQFGNTIGNSICTAACPMECSTIEFDIKSYTGRYPTSFYTDVLQSWAQFNGISLNYSDVPNSFAKVNIYYHSMQYKTAIQSQQYQPIDLLGNLGGVMGLWIGGCVLTAVELIELVFNFVFILVKYMLARRQNTIKILVNSNNQYN